MIREEAKPQPGRASGTRATAMAVRTATELSFGANRAQRGRVISWPMATRARNRPYPGGDPALSVTTGTAHAARLYGAARRPGFRRTSSAGPPRNRPPHRSVRAALPQHHMGSSTRWNSAHLAFTAARILPSLSCNKAGIPNWFFGAQSPSPSFPLFTLR